MIILLILFIWQLECCGTMDSSSWSFTLDFSENFTVIPQSCCVNPPCPTNVLNPEIHSTVWALVIVVMLLSHNLLCAGMCWSTSGLSARSIGDHWTSRNSLWAVSGMCVTLTIIYMLRIMCQSLTDIWSGGVCIVHYSVIPQQTVLLNLSINF